MVQLPPGRISNYERALILEELGKIAQEKYDEYVVFGGLTLGYNLRALKGSLHFESDIINFENYYYLQGTDEKWTDIANYFEYGTGLYNTKRAGKYRGGYIKPVHGEYMRFISKKTGKFVIIDKVHGVRPVMAMQKAEKYIQFNREKLQREIRIRLRLLGLINDQEIDFEPEEERWFYE